MAVTFPDRAHSRLLATLEQLLAIDATVVGFALTECSDMIAAALGADKVDIFVYEPVTASLDSVGSSRALLDQSEQDPGMERLSLATNCQATSVFMTGSSYISEQPDNDLGMPVGVVSGLGSCSVIAVPFSVGLERRGVLQVLSAQPGAFINDDLLFMQAAARWLGGIMQRSELLEQIARDAAEDAMQVTADELVTVVAHDLNNHLMPLQGRLNMIIRRAQRNGDQEYLKDAATAVAVVKRLGAFVHDLLDVARLEQGIFTISPQQTDLAAMAQEVAAAMSSDNRPVHVATSAELPIEADPHRLRQVLENLVANAVKHSPDSVPVEIAVAAEQGATGAWWVVTVRDRGPGIAAEVLSALFRRFSPGPGSSGLGLGLYVAQRITWAHGGTLEVKTSPEQGTEFRLALPAAQSVVTR